MRNVGERLCLLNVDSTYRPALLRDIIHTAANMHKRHRWSEHRWAEDDRIALPSAGSSGPGSVARPEASHSNAVPRPPLNQIHRKEPHPR